MAESAHNRLVTLLDADPGLATLSGRELGALVGVKACTANLYRRQWQRGELPGPWGVNVQRDNGPCCRLCTILESDNESLVDGLCVSCWWRLDGGNLYDYRHGLDAERWERLREAMAVRRKAPGKPDALRDGSSPLPDKQLYYTEKVYSVKVEMKQKKNKSGEPSSGYSPGRNRPAKDRCATGHPLLIRTIGRFA